MVYWTHAPYLLSHVAITSDGLLVSAVFLNLNMGWMVITYNYMAVR